MYVSFAVAFFSFSSLFRSVPFLPALSVELCDFFAVLLLSFCDCVSYNEFMGLATLFTMHGVHAWFGDSMRNCLFF